MGAGCEVADRVEPLADGEQRSFEREVVAGRDEERAGDAARTEQCRKSRQESVDEARLCFLEQRVQRVLQWAGAVEDRDRLRHAGKLGTFGVQTEMTGQLDRKRLDVLSEDDRQPSRKKLVCDLFEMLARGGGSSARGRRLLAKDRRLEALKQRARLDAELGDERRARLAVCLERLGLAPRPVEREHQLATQPLTHGMLRDGPLEVGNELGMTPDCQLRLGVLLDQGQP